MTDSAETEPAAPPAADHGEPQRTCEPCGAVLGPGALPEALALFDAYHADHATP